MIVQKHKKYAVQCDECGNLTRLEDELLDARRAAHSHGWWQEDWHTAEVQTEDFCPACYE